MKALGKIPSALDLVKGEIYLTHTWGQDEWVEVLTAMQQSYKVRVLMGERWWFETVNSIRNHMGHKNECALCRR